MGGGGARRLDSVKPRVRRDGWMRPSGMRLGPAVHAARVCGPRMCVYGRQSRGREERGLGAGAPFGARVQIQSRCVLIFYHGSEYPRRTKTDKNKGRGVRRHALHPATHSPGGVVAEDAAPDVNQHGARFPCGPVTPSHDCTAQLQRPVVGEGASLDRDLGASESIAVPLAVHLSWPGAVCEG